MPQPGPCAAGASVRSADGPVDISRVHSGECVMQVDGNAVGQARGKPRSKRSSSRWPMRPWTRVRRSTPCAGWSPRWSPSETTCYCLRRSTGTQGQPNARRSGTRRSRNRPHQAVASSTTPSAWWLSMVRQWSVRETARRVSRTPMWPIQTATSSRSEPFLHLDPGGRRLNGAGRSQPADGRAGRAGRPAVRSVSGQSASPGPCGSRDVREAATAPGEDQRATDRATRKPTSSTRKVG